MTPPPKETALAIPGPLRSMAQRLDLDENTVSATLGRTICQKATPEEIIAFCIVANEHKLNPFKKEIYAFPKKGGGIVPMVPIDGWTHIVNANADFDGCEFEEHEDAEGKVEAITCTMHVKGRAHPIILKERLKECFRPTEPWKQMPCRMLRHKAFMQAARIAFSLGGIFDQDETDDQVRRDAASNLEPPKRLEPSRRFVDSEVVEPTPPATEKRDEEKYPEGDLISEAQRRRMFALARESGISTETIKAHLLKKYGVESSKLITSDIYEEVCEWTSNWKPPAPAPTTSLH